MTETIFLYRFQYHAPVPDSVALRLEGSVVLDRNGVRVLHTERRRNTMYEMEPYGRKETTLVCRGLLVGLKWEAADNVPPAVQRLLDRIDTEVPDMSGVHVESAHAFPGIPHGERVRPPLYFSTSLPQDWRDPVLVERDLSAEQWLGLAHWHVMNGKTGEDRWCRD